MQHDATATRGFHFEDTEQAMVLPHPHECRGCRNGSAERYRRPAAHRYSGVSFAALSLPLLREIPVPQSSACVHIFAPHPVPIQRMALRVPRLGNGDPGR
jgi:hypothetical protein